MPFTSIQEVKTDSDYKRILKEELAKARGKPARFQYFEGFTFAAAGKKPLLLVGPVGNDLVDDVKKSGATFKAKGRCQRRRGGKAGDVDFACDDGKMPADKLVLTLRWAGAASAADNPGVVDELGLADDADVEVPPDAPTPANAKDMQAFAAESQKLQQRLDTIKTAEPSVYAMLAPKLSGAYGSMKSGDTATANQALAELAQSIAKVEVAIATRAASKKQAATEREAEHAAARKEVAEANPDQALGEAKQRLQALVARSKVALQALPDEALELEVARQSKLAIAALATKKLDTVPALLDGLDKLVAAHEKLALPGAREKAKAAASGMAEARRKADDALGALEKDPRHTQDAQALAAARQKLDDKSVRLKELQAQLTELQGKRAKARANQKKKFDEPAEDRQEREKLKGEVAQLRQDITSLTQTLVGQEQAAADLVRQLEALTAQIDQLIPSASEHRPPTDEELVAYKSKPDPNKDAISRHADIQAARDAVKGQLGEMAQASQWQGKEIERAEGNPRDHGTGRHGAQTGIEGQGRRLATEEAPDQPGNKSGVTRSTGATTRWREIDIEWQELPSGKRRIVNETAVHDYVADWSNKPDVGATASLFLNPVLEKYAVDLAIKTVKAKCDWTWIDDGGWKRLKKIAVIVPAKPGTAGYGFAVQKKNTLPPATVRANAAARIQDFVEGRKTIEQLMTDLDVALRADATGTGAKILPRAKVVLYRDAIENKDWINETQFPVDDAAGWEIQGMTVAKGTGQPTGATPTQPAPALVF